MLIPPRGGSLLDSSVRGGVGAAKIGAHCWTESIQIHGVNVGCYPSRYSEDFWRGTSGRGNGNCGHPCTEFDENYPFDYTCTVAKGVFHEHLNNYSCYQWKETTKYCWTHQSPGNCHPLGYVSFLEDSSLPGWHYADVGPVKRSDLNSCGPPCKEFDSKYN